jgi:ABC-type antimicrobial peptide transport system permease subunit
MKISPPKWADKFLQWYCRTDLLEEIQGDAYELFYRTAKESKRKADLYFVWNVFRFFRFKNIKKRKSSNPSSISTAMIKNMFLVTMRNFMRQPGHSFLNVFGLVVGFTCAILILFWVEFEFSFDKFHSNTDRLFKVITHVEGEGNVQTYPLASAVLDVSSIPEAEKLVSVSTGERWPNVLCFKPENKNSECIYLNGVYSNENLFSVFNFPILKGDADPLRQSNNIAISEKMASTLYGSESPIGKTLKIDTWIDVTIVSVFKDVPSNSSLQFDFAMPYAIVIKLWGGNKDRFAENFFNTYLRCNTAITPKLLTEKLNDVRVVTETNKAQKISYEAVPLTNSRLKSKYEDGKQVGGRIEYLNLFGIIGALVVIMAVINFVNMSTARATLRAKEIGIRKVTGAVRNTIAAQFMGESFLIVLLAFILSIFASQFCLPLFNSLLAEPIRISIFSGAIPFYLTGFLLVIALLAGVYPSIVMSSFQPVRILKGQLSSVVSGSQRFRKTLLVVQLSASMGIIIFSGVLYLQLNYIDQKNLGFDRKNMIRVEPSGNLYRKFDAFKNELSKNPSIIGIATSNANLLNAEGGNTGVSWSGKPSDLRISFKTIACSYEFPETFGLKVVDGRNFRSQPSDTVNTEALITQEAAKTMGLKKPIGETIKIGDASCLIIGIVNDFHSESLHESRLPTILYRAPYMQTSAIYIKYQSGATQEALEAVRQAYNKFETNFTMKYWFQDDTFNEVYKTEITATRVILLFTGIELIIALIGIIGLATFNTMRKTKEIGVRRVFGASIAQSLFLLFNEFLLLLMAAAIIASGVAWYAADKWLQGFAYRTSIPWWIFVATFAGTGLLVATIIFVQGWRTVTTNPTSTLRSE